jgi:hypothetical protein
MTPDEKRRKGMTFIDSCLSTLITRGLIIFTYRSLNQDITNFIFLINNITGVLIHIIHSMQDSHGVLYVKSGQVKFAPVMLFVGPRWLVPAHGTGQQPN